MPTYEYACKFCGHEFETFQSIKDAPLRKCPACKKAGLRRLISGGAGLIFKGSGFYETDYRRPGAKTEPASEKNPTESKPATKTETPKPKTAPAKA
ncbi:MAG: zinc ribbon domain-containing protein [Opitutales bacterium]|jgi:putative FmdB family regulatory protein